VKEGHHFPRHIKVKRYGENVGEPIANLKGTECEHIGKSRKMKKNLSSPPPTPKHKRKKNKAP